MVSQLMRLEGKVALITGGASGFGAEIARRFVSEGASVVIMDLNGDGARKVASEIGNAKGLKGDVALRSDIDEAVQFTIKAFGRVDVAVNNAGWTHRNKPLQEVTEQEFDRIYAINVKSIFHMTNCPDASATTRSRLLPSPSKSTIAPGAAVPAMTASAPSMRATSKEGVD